jgi:hypothetical protein
MTKGSYLKMKKSLFTITACLLAAQAWGFGIHNNSGSAGADSISIPFVALDSAGNVVAMASGDSVYFNVYFPDGSLAYRDSGAYNAAEITSQTVSSYTEYTWRDAIATIDGGTPTEGTYSYLLIIKDLTGAAIATPHRGTFQLYAESDFDISMDYIKDVLDSIQNQDNWVSSFDAAEDTVFSDIAKISGDRPAADNFETMLDGAGGNRLTLAGMDIHASGNDTGIVIEGNGTGTGLGIYILGGGNGGEGMKVVGGNTRSALVAQAGSTIGATHGFDLIGTGDGFGLNGSFSSTCRQDIAGTVWDEDTSGHNGSGSFAAMLKDTAAYQGSASGLTAAEVADSVWGHHLDTAWTAGAFGDSASGWGATAASSLDSGLIQRINNRQLDSTQNAQTEAISANAVDAIWDELQSGHTVSGSFGAYLDTPVSEIGPTGTGSYPVGLTVYDSISDQVVPGARVSIYNSALNAMMALGATGADGKASFNLDSNSYVTSTFAPGYVFGTYDTIIVEGALVDTIVGHRFDPGSPASPELCRVYGFLYGIDGLAIEGVSVTAQLTEGVARHNSMIVSPYRRSSISDSTGYFAIDLIPSASMNPAGSSYLISASYPSGTILKKTITVPDLSSWLLDW